MLHQAQARYQLFVSYAEADHEWVEGYLLDALKKAGVSCHSESSFELGKPRLLEFDRAIQCSDRILLVLSPAYLADGYNQFVDLVAQNFGLEHATWPVIPLLLGQVNLPPRLSMLTSLDAVDQADWPRVIERLCADLQRPIPPPPARLPCPYPGMVPFGLKDSDQFFGRDKEINQILEGLRLHQFLTIIGASGSGKSSLVFAGLVPELRKTGLFGPGEWCVRTLRPGDEPFAALSAALKADLADLNHAVCSNLATEPNARRLLLIVDQFEEVFTLARKDTAPFQQTLLRLIAVPDCYTLLTVRADFYGDLMISPLWQEIRGHRIELLPLDHDELRAAIMKPAGKAGVFIESALVERLLADTGDEPGVLPFVQETLVLLWEKAQRRFLPLAAYEEMADGERTGLQVAIAKRADAAISDLHHKQKTMVQRMLLRLVQFGEGRPDTRRRQLVSALRSTDDDTSDFNEVLQHLTENRLLTLSGEEGAEDKKADISHESLISGWPTLQSWLRERRIAEQMRRRLEEKVVEWERLGRSVGGLLDEVELREAETWLAQPESTELGVTEELSDFVRLSREEIEKTSREKEESRQRELEAARSLAESRQRELEGERRLSASERRRARIILGALTVVSVALALMFVFMRQSQARQSHLLASQSQEKTAVGDGVDGIRLALGSIEASRLPDAFDAIWQGVRFALAVLEPSGLRDAFDAIWRNELASIYDRSPINDAGRALFAAVQVNREQADLLNSGCSASFSPDGKRIVTTSRDTTALVWDISDHKVVTLKGHSSPIYSVAFSNNGSLIATASGPFPPAPSGDNTARLWDARTGRPLVVLKGHSGPVYYVAFDSKDKYIVTASNDGTARLWDISNVQTLKPEPSSPLTAIAVLSAGLGDEPSQSQASLVRWAEFGLDKNHIVTASDDGKARIWDVSKITNMPQRPNAIPLNPELVLKVLDPAGSVFSAKFNSEGNRIITAAGYSAKVWEATSTIGFNREPQPQITLKGQQGLVRFAAFSPKGSRMSRIVTTSEDWTAEVWDAKSGASLHVLRGHNGAVLSAAFNHDGSRIVTASADNTARVWDTESGDPLLVLSGHSGPVYSAEFSPDERNIVTASEDGTTRIWSAVPGPPWVALHGHTDTVNSAVFNSAGSRIVTASEDGTARVWDVGTGESQVLQSGNGHIVSAAFGPRETVITVARNGKIEMWSTPGNTDVWNSTVVAPASNGISLSTDSVHFSRDGAHFVVISDVDGAARVWDSVSRQNRLLREGIHYAAFSPDGSEIVTGSYDGSADVWHIDDLTHPISLKKNAQRRDTVESADFSPDGSRIVIGLEDGSVQIWDAATGLSPPLKADDFRLDYVGFGSNRDYVITSSNGKVRMWDVNSARPLRWPDGQLWAQGTLWALSVDRSRMLVKRDKSALVADAGSGQPLALIPEEIDEAAFSPNASELVTISKKTASVWHLFPKLETLTHFATKTCVSVRGERECQHLAEGPITPSEGHCPRPSNAQTITSDIMGIPGN